VTGQGLVVEEVQVVLLEEVLGLLARHIHEDALGLREYD